MSDLDIQAYLGTYQQLKQAIADLDDEQLTWKESEGKWSVTEVLTHLVDHNIVVSFRIRDILAGTTVQLPAFNQDRWVAGQEANASNPGEILEVFLALIRYNSLLFQRLKESDFEKSGINFKGETVKIRDIIHGFTRHVQNHLAQIERIRSAYSQRMVAQEGNA